MRIAGVILAITIITVPAVFGSPASAFLLPEERAEHMACDPNTFSVSRTIVDPRHYSYEIRGALETPTPGYAYELTRDIPAGEIDPLVHHLRLKLTAPQGVVIQVIGALEIDETMILPDIKTERVVIAIDKTFGWGPEKITCVVPYE